MICNFARRNWSLAKQRNAKKFLLIKCSGSTFSFTLPMPFCIIAWKIFRSSLSSPAFCNSFAVLGKAIKNMQQKRSRKREIPTRGRVQGVNFKLLSSIKILYNSFKEFLLLGRLRFPNRQITSCGYLLEWKHKHHRKVTLGFFNSICRPLIFVLFAILPFVRCRQRELKSLKITSNQPPLQTIDVAETFHSFSHLARLFCSSRWWPRYRQMSNPKTTKKGFTCKATFHVGLLLCGRKLGLLT